MAQFRPVSSLWLPETHRFGLGWMGAEGRVAYTWHRVEGRRFVRNKPFQRGFNALASRGSQTGIQLKDENSDDILKVSLENADSLIKHVGIGLAPSSLRVYPKFPDSSDLPRLDGTDVTTVGDDKGFLTGIDSPYHEPTDALEFFIPYSVTGTFNHFNPVTLDPTGSQMLPKYNVEIMQYRVEHLDPKDSEIAPLIAAMAAGRAQVRLYMMGPPDQPISFPGSLQTIWGVAPITLRDARKLVGGSA